MQDPDIIAGDESPTTAAVEKAMIDVVVLESGEDIAMPSVQGGEQELLQEMVRSWVRKKWVLQQPQPNHAGTAWLLRGSNPNALWPLCVCLFVVAMCRPPFFSHHRRRRQDDGDKIR